MNPSYCDAITHCLHKLLQAAVSGAVNLDLDDAEKVIKAVGSTKLDIGPDGEYLSSMKQFMVADTNGRMYMVTVQEAS